MDINDELIWYYNVLTALQEATINFEADFVKAPLPADAAAGQAPGSSSAQRLSEGGVHQEDAIPGSSEAFRAFCRDIAGLPQGPGGQHLLHSRVSPPPKDLHLMLSWVVMSNQRFLKIVCFRFPTNVPQKNRIYLFLKQNSLSNQNVLFQI
jgi:hypothetical protein